MASRGLGSLTLDLIAKIGGFTGPLTQAERAANRSMSNIEKRANSFGRVIGSSLRSAAGQFLAFAGVTASVGAALASLKSAIDLADETRDLSIRLGESTETISEFRYAAQQTGTDMEALGKGMKILAKNAADAINPLSSQAKVFDALGIKVTDAQGNLKKLGDLVPEIADKFKSLEDGTTKAALAQALFGKSGLDLTEFLNQGADGLQTMADKARELGIVINQETADAADKFNDDLADLKAATGGLALQVAEKLLPALDELLTWATAFVKDGANSAEIAHDIAGGFDAIVEAGKGVGQVFKFLEGLRTVLSGLTDQAAAMGDTLRAALSFDLKGLEDSSRRFQESKKEIEAGMRGESYNRFRGSQFQDVVSHSSTKGLFDDVVSSSRTTGGSEAERRIARALSNPTATHTPKHSGKSEAEREAERLAKAINQMTDAQRDWETELAGTGNKITDDYAKRLADITEKAEDFQRNGVPTDKIEAFKKSMSDLALQIKDKELKQFQEDFKNETLDLAAALGGPADQANRQYEASLRDLEKQMKSGILTAEEFNERSSTLNELRHSDAILLLRDLQEEANMLGMTNEQQEIYNNLKATGTTANDAYGQSIIKATEELQKQRKSTEEQTEIMDSLRESARGFLTDLKDGVGVWDALKDGVNGFADALFDIIARDLIGQIFGQPGTTGTGSSGAGWLSALVGLFGGSGFGGEGSPLANGGWTEPNKYHQVGEYNMPEMFTRGGKQYLIPGDRGRVTPMRGGGGLNMVVNNNYASPESPYVQSQVAAKQGALTGLALRRNGR